MLYVHIFYYDCLAGISVVLLNWIKKKQQQVKWELQKTHKIVVPLVLLEINGMCCNCRCGGDCKSPCILWTF